MNLNTFIQLYKEFLKECKQKGWSVEILIEDTGDYLTLLKNKEKGRQTGGRFLRLQTQEPSLCHTSDSRTKAVSKPPLVASERDV